MRRGWLGVRRGRFASGSQPQEDSYEGIDDAIIKAI